MKSLAFCRPDLNTNDHHNDLNPQVMQASVAIDGIEALLQPWKITALQMIVRTPSSGNLTILNTAPVVPPPLCCITACRWGMSSDR
jgi:hypothetical protein